MRLDELEFARLALSRGFGHVSEVVAIERHRNLRVTCNPPNPHHQRDRAPERGIPPSVPVPGRAALGPAGRRTDQDAQGRRLGTSLSAPRAHGTWLRDLSGANFTSPDHAAREFPPGSRHDRGDPGGRINSSSPDRQLPDQRHSTLSHLALWFLRRPHAYLGHRCYRETGCRRF